jgi:hypothetical protein
MSPTAPAGSGPGSSSGSDARGLTHHPAAPSDPDDVAGFPSRDAAGTWFRAHVDRVGPDRGCWWFSSVGGDPDRSGRFDLPAPGGTCYFASTDEAAARERVGTQLRRTAGRQSVLASVLATTTGPVVVTEVTLGAVDAANLPVRKADRWVNRSLWVGTGIYAISQGWAALWRAAGFEALLYEPRFTGGARVRALALFGPAGRPKPVPPVEDSQPLEDILTAHGVRVVWPPGSATTLPSTAAPPPL